MKTNSIIILITLIVMFHFSSCKKTATETVPAEQLVGEYQGTFGPLGYPSTSEVCNTIITKPSANYIDISMNYSFSLSGKKTSKTITLQNIKISASTAFDGKSESFVEVENPGSTLNFYPKVKGSVGGGSISFTIGDYYSFTGKKK